jgi:hypothetical protein
VKTAHGDRPPRPPFGRDETHSTVGDLVAFANALTSNRLLDRAHTELLLRPEVAFSSDLPGADYAYGFLVWNGEGIDDVGHDGGSPGVNAGFRILDHGRAVVAVLSNVAPTWRANKLCEFIAARLRFD